MLIFIYADFDKNILIGNTVHHRLLESLSLTSVILFYNNKFCYCIERYSQIELITTWKSMSTSESNIGIAPWQTLK